MLYSGKATEETFFIEVALPLIIGLLVWLRPDELVLQPKCFFIDFFDAFFVEVGLDIGLPYRGWVLHRPEIRAPNTGPVELSKGFLGIRLHFLQWYNILNQFEVEDSANIIRSSDPQRRRICSGLPSPPGPLKSALFSACDDTSDPSLFAWSWWHMYSATFSPVPGFFCWFCRALLTSGWASLL